MNAGIDFTEFRRGWPPLVAATLGNATGVGAIMYYSMSSFMLPLEQEFGWSRSDMGFAVSCLVFGWIISMPVIGSICDRFGPRRPILVSIPLLALVLASLSTLDGQLYQLYLMFFIGALVGSGTLAVSYIAAVSCEFVANRGLAYGITLAGTGISAFALPLGLLEVIVHFDWRTAWLVLALVSLVQWPIAFFCISRRDVQQRGDSGYSGESDSGLYGYTLSEVLVMRNFWLLALAFMLIALLLSGLLINLIPLLSEAGMSTQQAATAASGIGVGLLFARVFVGYLLDRLPARWVAVFAFAIAAAGCFLLSAGRPSLAGLGALALGFTVGSELDLLAYMTARYFGTRSHSSVYAVSLSLFYVGAVIAPVLVGELYALSQNYAITLQATVVSCVLASALVLMLGPYPESFGDDDPVEVAT